MSNQRVFTGLQGYQGPYFPPGTEKIQMLYAGALALNAIQLRKVAESVCEVIGLPAMKTADKYNWFRSIIFKSDEGDYASVLFPWARDELRRDGTVADRHVAVYSQSGYNEAAIVNQLADAISDFLVQRGSMYGATASGIIIPR